MADDPDLPPPVLDYVRAGGGPSPFNDRLRWQAIKASALIVVGVVLMVPELFAAAALALVVLGRHVDDPPGETVQGLVCCGPPALLGFIFFQAGVRKWGQLSRRSKRSID